MSYLVAKSMIRAKTAFRGLPVPTAIALSCPHCHEFLTYSCRDYLYHAATQTITFLGTCPACSGKVSFWQVNSRDGEKSQIFMYPAATHQHQVIPGIEYVPQPIAENYREALQTYHHRYYKAATTMVRASLEVIFKTVLGDGEIKELAALIQELAQKNNLTEQVTDIATTIADSPQLLAYLTLTTNQVRILRQCCLNYWSYPFLHLCPPGGNKRLQHEISCLEQAGETE